MNKKSEPVEFPAGTYKNAEFIVTFSDRGKIVVQKEDQLLVEGTYTVSGDRIVLTDEKGPLACKDPGTETGEYQWRIDAKGLNFIKLRDLCEGRITSLAGQPLVVVKN